MSKLSRILFLIVGVVFPILIGLLHLVVHLTQLVSPEIQDYLQKEFMYSGKIQPLWDAWGIASFMMGISFVVIGLLNISILRRLSINDYPPVLSIISMMVYLSGVIYVGIEFEQSMQLYGGIFGGLLIACCLILTLKGNKL